MTELLRSAWYALLGLPSAKPRGLQSPYVVEVRPPHDVLESVVSGDAGRRLRSNAPSILSQARLVIGEQWHPTLLFDQARASAHDQAVVVSEAQVDAGDLWFIGDLHGDLLALECALAHIEGVSLHAAPARLVFLGDLIDDGGFGYEVVLRVLKLVAEGPERVCVLAGNHDEALTLDTGTGVFGSDVEPCDFSDWLNTDDVTPAARIAGELLVRLMARAPRALFLPDGLLVAHGGVPQSDLWDGLVDRQALNQALCLQDFVWTRAHPRAKRRYPNRESRGAEFGREDFRDFCGRVSDTLGRPVTRMVRGHDHVPERFACHGSDVGHPILTINTLSRRLSRESAGSPSTYPCIARWVHGSIPEIHRITIAEQATRAVYPEAFLTD